MFFLFDPCAKYKVFGDRDLDAAELISFSSLRLPAIVTMDRECIPIFRTVFTRPHVW